MAKKEIRYPNLLGVSVDDEVLEKIRKIADEKKWSISQTVRELVEEVFNMGEQTDG